MAWKLAVVAALAATAFGVCQVNRAARRPPADVDPRGEDRTEAATVPDRGGGRNLPSAPSPPPTGFS